MSLTPKQMVDLKSVLEGFGGKALIHVTTEDPTTDKKNLLLKIQAVCNDLLGKGNSQVIVTDANIRFHLVDEHDGKGPQFQIVPLDMRH